MTRTDPLVDRSRYALLKPAPLFLVWVWRPYWGGWRAEAGADIEAEADALAEELGGVVELRGMGPPQGHHD